jgi:hypothetical protein
MVDPAGPHDLAADALGAAGARTAPMRSSAKEDLVVTERFDMTS